MKKYQLFYLTCWIQSKSQQKTTLSLSLDKKPPLVKKNYISGQKIYCFDVASEIKLPVITINYQNSEEIILLKKSQLSQQSPIVIQYPDFKIFLTAQLLENTDKIYDKYCSERSDEEKLHYAQGVTDFIRSEGQFMSIFDKNEDVVLVKVAQMQERLIEKKLSADIVEIKKVNVSIKKLILISIICFIIGMLSCRFLSNSEQQITKVHKNKKKKEKPIKIEQIKTSTKTKKKKVH